MSSLFEWYAMLLTKGFTSFLERCNQRMIHFREFGSRRNHPLARSSKCSFRRDLKEAFTVPFPKGLHVVLEQFVKDHNWILSIVKDSAERQVGIAFRTVFEVEGHYVEIPTAFTLHKVPTRFLIVVGAVLIGISTGKAAQIHALLGGAVGGAASLLINILA